MKPVRPILFAAAIILVGGCASASFEEMVAASLKEQEARNEAATPLLDAVVTRKLKIGDTVDHAKEVLAAAGLDSHIEHFAPELRSIYRTGHGCGFTIVLLLDNQERISKIDVQPFFTGP